MGKNRTKTTSADHRLFADLERMHADLKSSMPKPGDEAYSLMCSIGAAMGRWPRVKLAKAAEIRKRYGLWLHRRVKTTATEAADDHLEAIARGWKCL